MNYTTSTSRLTERISVPCTPALKRMIQQRAAACQQTESEYIRRLIETASINNQPSLSDEALKRMLFAYYNEQQEDRKDFNKAIGEIENSLYQITLKFENYTSNLNGVFTILIRLIETLAADLEARAVTRSRFYYWRYSETFKDSNILYEPSHKS